MKTFVYLFAILIGAFVFTACTDDAADDVKPVDVPEVPAPESEDLEEDVRYRSNP